MPRRQYHHECRGCAWRVLEHLQRPFLTTNQWHDIDGEAIVSRCIAHPLFTYRTRHDRAPAGDERRVWPVDPALTNELASRFPAATGRDIKAWPVSAAKTATTRRRRRRWRCFVRCSAFGDGRGGGELARAGCPSCTGSATPYPKPNTGSRSARRPARASVSCVLVGQIQHQADKLAVHDGARLLEIIAFGWPLADHGGAFADHNSQQVAQAAGKRR